jgi:hypothetical protein
MPFGDPYTLTPAPIPQPIQQYMFEQTGELKYHMQLVSARFDTASPLYMEMEGFCANIVKDFPVLAEVRPSHVFHISKGVDPAQGSWSFMEIRCEPQGTHYFLFQGIEPDAFFMDDVHFTPFYSRERAIQSLAPGTAVALAKVTKITPYICSNCRAKPTSKLLACRSCREATQNKIYYCSAACQRAHWKVHKVVCSRV